MAVNLVAGGVVFAPMALPLMSPEGTLAYMQRLGIVPAAQEVGHTSALPQYFSDRFGWEELAQKVSEVYKSLPEEERSGCVVFGRNYGHAGSLEYWSKRYELPPVACLHNNYWMWGPPAVGADDVMIVIRGSRESLEGIFEEVVEAGEVVTPHAMESHMTIWVCRGLRRPIEEIWAENKAYG
jgi:hypothetical protein